MAVADSAQPQLPEPARPSPFYTEEHEAFRQTVRRFVDREIMPYVDQWDEAEEFPRELYRTASAAGLLQLGFPEEYGGVPTDPFFGIVKAEEMARHGSGGVNASLNSHTIGCPPIAALGPEWMKRKVLPEVLAGDKISALAITEPSGGSDVANLKTTARREGDHFVVNGSKMFITSGVRADYFTVAVRTGGPGAGGVSLLLIERDREGFGRTKLKKMGWWASDTAQLFFDDVRVPVDNLIGVENKGFIGIMLNFNQERLGMAAGACGYARVCLDEAIAYARERHTFGKPLIANQVVRHRLVDMAMRINAAKSALELLTWRVTQGEKPIAEICMLKNL
ncbi:MAG: acyl-CoA dehydrogenase family protein, partial [Alphaproteobacteria bacterium]|nr:acyl-CoA dehydrogenase family protein [Alphaproteobacteria bacterium]